MINTNTHDHDYGSNEKSMQILTKRIARTLWYKPKSSVNPKMHNVDITRFSLKGESALNQQTENYKRRKNEL